MQYRIQPLQKRHLGQERFEEIVSEVALRVDERRFGRAVIAWHLSNILSRVMDFEQSNIMPYSDYNENYKKLVHNVRTFLSELKLIESETIINYYIHEMLKEAVLKQMAELKIKSDDKMISESESYYQRQMEHLREQYMLLLRKGQEQMAKDIEELTKTKGLLIEEMDQLQKALTSLKQEAINALMGAAKHINVNETKLFADMSKSSLHEFLDDYLDIDEEAENASRPIEKEIKRIRETQRQQADKKDTGAYLPLTDVSLSTEIYDREQRLRKILEEKYEKMARAGDRRTCQPISHQVSKETLARHVQVFEAEPAIHAIMELHRQRRRRENKQMRRCAKKMEAISTRIERRTQEQEMATQNVPSVIILRGR